MSNCQKGKKNSQTTSKWSERNIQVPQLQSPTIRKAYELTWPDQWHDTSHLKSLYTIMARYIKHHQTRKNQLQAPKQYSPSVRKTKQSANILQNKRTTIEIISLIGLQV